MYSEKEKAMIKNVESNFYIEELEEFADVRNSNKSHSFKPEQMPWETCPQGIMKHLTHRKLDNLIESVDISMQYIPVGSRSGKHRHMSEEFMFILEGKGYSLHWDVNAFIDDKYYWKAEEEPTKWEWEAGDSVYIPPNTIHQHFNADSTPVRFLTAESRIMKHLKLHDLEQLENAPEYEQKK